jgi:hypothetical protein
MAFEDEDENETKTGNEVTTVKSNLKSSTALTPASDNPFADYADAALSNNINGTLLIFSKGDWICGREKKPVPIGAKMVCNMDSFSIGWQKWSGGRTVETIMGRVVDRFRPPQRHELGDNDEELWELGNDGKPKNPWQYTVKLELADPETTEVFTFPTSSSGGRGALDKLCKAYSVARARHKNEWPIVELGADSYPHPNKTFGRVKFPVLTICGWIAKDAGSAGDPTPAPTLVSNPLGDDDVPPPSGPDDYGFDDDR